MGLAQTCRDLWLAFTGQQPVPPARPEVIFHDPGAQRPHDLDDPFIDPQVQSRVGGVIANNATKKH
jgi:hypothetical protein